MSTKRKTRRHLVGNIEFEKMLCACSGEHFKFEEPPHSPESLATRDFSASGLSSRTGEWESRLEDTQVDEAESTLKEALSLNYEEARALLGRLEYQKGNFDAALQVFQGIDIKGLTPRMIKSIVERTRPRRTRQKFENVPSSVMSMHSVSLLLEAILLKAKSLEELGRYTEAAKVCKIILDTVESALPHGMFEGIGQDCKLQEVLHKGLELLPNLWTKAGCLDEAITAYRRALLKPWNLDPHRLAGIQKDLAAMLIYSGVESSISPQLQPYRPKMPKSNIEEAIFLLVILMKKVAFQEIDWDEEIMDHLTYSLSVSGLFLLLATHVEQILPGVYNRSERWYLLALCYAAAGQNETALNLLKKVTSSSEARHKPHFPSLLLGAKLCSQDPSQAHEGIVFSNKVIEKAKQKCQNFRGQGHKFFGICYGCLARKSVLDSERVVFQRESLTSLNYAASIENDDPELIFNLGLENAVQRNMGAAFDYAMQYSDMLSGSSVKGWRLLALVVSAQQRYKDAETIIDFALDEASSVAQLELLRLKAMLQIAQQLPKQAIDSYRILLSMIQAEKELKIQSKNNEQAKTSTMEPSIERKLEMSAWQDLASIYAKLGSWPDAESCIEKAKLVELFSPRSWHTTGKLLEAKSLYKEALVSFSTSLSIDPDYVPSIVSTAEMFLKLGGQSIPIVRSYLMNAMRLEPTNHDAWFALGLLSKREGLLQQAADCFQAAHELKLSSPVERFV